MSIDRELAERLLAPAAARVVRTVDGLSDDAWSEPSGLPDWSRAKVVAHLALNAEALIRVLHGVVADDEGDEGAGSPATMYDSDEQRAADIAGLATADPSDIRDRLLGATSTLADAIAAVPDDRWETRAERTPGGTSLRIAAIPGMRWRELEIHHVDLDAGYTTADWSTDFGEHLVDAMVKRLATEPAFEIRPLDSDRSWVVGSGGAEAAYPVPVVTGPVGDLGWWLTGRSVPETISCSQGELPTIEGW